MISDRLHDVLLRFSELVRLRCVSICENGVRKGADVSQLSGFPPPHDSLLLAS